MPDADPAMPRALSLIIAAEESVGARPARKSSPNIAVDATGRAKRRRF